MANCKIKRINIIEDVNRYDGSFFDIINSLKYTKVHHIKCPVNNDFKISNEYIPDILILDLNTSGNKYLKQIKKIRENYLDLQIIVLSNNPYHQLHQAYIKSGATYFLDKSKDLEKIIEVCSTP